MGTFDYSTTLNELLTTQNGLTAGGLNYNQIGGQYQPIFTPATPLFEPQSDTLSELIEKCGKNLYYLVSPYSRDDNNGLWHAKGRKFTGEGKTAKEALESLYNQLNP